MTLVSSLNTPSFEAIAQIARAAAGAGEGVV
jgi:hypothetical protein